jgi:hypothetical protein
LSTEAAAPGSVESSSRVGLANSVALGGALVNVSVMLRLAARFEVAPAPEHVTVYV